MTFIIIIFFIAIILAFGMLSFRAWEIKTERIENKEIDNGYTPELSYKNIEKIILYLIKHSIQWIVLTSVKIWFLFITKTKIWIQNKLPKINKIFERKPKTTDPRKISFVQRAIIESKIKIKRVKESIKKEHEEEFVEIKEINKVDKII